MRCRCSHWALPETAVDLFVRGSREAARSRSLSRRSRICSSEVVEEGICSWGERRIGSHWALGRSAVEAFVGRTCSDKGCKRAVLQSSFGRGSGTVVSHIADRRVWTCLSLHKERTGRAPTGLKERTEWVLRSLEKSLLKEKAPKSAEKTTKREFIFETKNRFLINWKQICFSKESNLRKGFLSMNSDFVLQKLILCLFFGL